MALCLCFYCIKSTYADNKGVNRHGLYVDHKTRKAHGLAKERNSAIASTSNQQVPNSESSSGLDNTHLTDQDHHSWVEQLTQMTRETSLLDNQRSAAGYFPPEPPTGSV